MRGRSPREMAVFENLSERLGDVFKKLRGQGHLTEENMQVGLREIRMALLEADVNFKVAKDLLARIKEKALGEEVLRSLTPGQQLIKIVRDEMVELLGGAHQELRFASKPPTVILMAGLQGSGKTTTTAKLGLRLRSRGRSPLLVPADLAALPPSLSSRGWVNWPKSRSFPAIRPPHRLRWPWRG